MATAASNDCGSAPQSGVARPPMPDATTQYKVGANYGQPITVTGNDNLLGKAVGTTISQGSNPQDKLNYDLASYWNGPRNPGETIDWAGGKLTYNAATGPSASPTAYYQNADGTTSILTPGMNAGEIARSNQNIANQWNGQYGVNLGPNAPGQPDPYATSTTASQQGNPYLDQMAEAIRQKSMQNYDRNIAPGLRSNAVMTGGYGGSRQGIAEGIALGDTQQGITNALANLYGGAYETNQNRGLQQNQFQQSLNEQQRQYNIGQNNWQNQFNQNSLLQGANLSQQEAMLPYQQLNQLLGIGNNLQNYQQSLLDAPGNALLKYASILQPGAGLGQSAIQTGGGGSSGAGMLGGALGGAQLGSQIMPGWGTAIGALAGGILGR